MINTLNLNKVDMHRIQQRLKERKVVSVISVLILLFLGYLLLGSSSSPDEYEHWTFRSKYDGSYDVPKEKGVFTDNFKGAYFFKEPIQMETLLENANDLIYRYVDLPLEFSMGSAAIPLAVCGLITTGDILELGMGTFSTNVIHKIGADFNRQVTSVDHDLAWLQRFLLFNTTRTHSIFHMKDIQQLKTYGSDRKWGMVLVDHKLGEERFINIIDLKNKADIVLAHDAENRGAGNYKYVEKKVTDHYKYVCKMSMLHSDNEKNDGYTSTLIMSNFIDLSYLEQVFKKIKYNRKVIACDYTKY